MCRRSCSNCRISENKPLHSPLAKWFPVALIKVLVAARQPCSVKGLLNSETQVFINVYRQKIQQTNMILLIVDPFLPRLLIRHIPNI